MNCFNVVSKGPKIRAVGGEISFYKNYVIHQFKTTGITDTFLPYSDIELEYLVIAGGGAGGENAGAGGGAGGYRCSVPNEYSGGLSDPEEKYDVIKGVGVDVVVGSGGIKLYIYEGTRYSGGPGQNSFFGNIVSIGGGGGAAGGNYKGTISGLQGKTGGSGGGSTAYRYTAGTILGGLGTDNQGFSSGTSRSSINNTFTSSGGGGAGGLSPNSLNSGRQGGVGGVGIQSSITGFPFFRAAGGSSDLNTTQSSGIGGAYHLDPIENTGSGGGLVHDGFGDGANGIVIVRYRN